MGFYLLNNFGKISLYWMNSCFIRKQSFFEYNSLGSFNANLLKAFLLEPFDTDFSKSAAAFLEISW